jgi:hypothetical protein
VRRGHGLQRRRLVEEPHDDAAVEGGDDDTAERRERDSVHGRSVDNRTEREVAVICRGQ